MFTVVRHTVFAGRLQLRPDGPQPRRLLPDGAGVQGLRVRVGPPARLRLRPRPPQRRDGGKIQTCDLYFLKFQVFGILGYEKKVFCLKNLRISVFFLQK